MNLHFDYMGGEIYQLDNAFQLSKFHMLEHLRNMTVEAGLPVLTVDEALENIEAEGDNIAWFGGRTFLALVRAGQNWHQPIRILTEEAVGPKVGYSKIDLDEFLAGMLALAKHLECEQFQVGTMANPRQSALARMYAAKGVSPLTTTLYRNVTHG